MHLTGEAPAGPPSPHVAAPTTPSPSRTLPGISPSEATRNPQAVGAINAIEICMVSDGQHTALDSGRAESNYHADLVPG
ncbi:hypothetical protein GCM10025762_12720 [Haloechinothrix salitolerans]